MSHSNFVMDPEHMQEMVRLSSQGRMLTAQMLGTLPELDEQERAKLHDVLDLACGPGEWALQLAYESGGDMHVVGVDISSIMIEYARMQAQARNLSADFAVMNILQHPLPWPEASFDLVNARLLFAFMLPSQWSSLLRECHRILRPGGLIRLTETERTLSNNAVFERYMSLWAESFYRDGRSFSPDGLHYGLLPMLKRLLKQAGYTDVRHIPYMIDVSADTGTPHQLFFENMLLLFLNGRPFLQRMARTQSELDEIKNVLYEQLRALVGEEEFSAYWPLMTFLARKPSQVRDEIHD